MSAPAAQRIRNGLRELLKITRDHRLRVWFCELQVVYHCNLTCRACNHLSPVMTPHFADPDVVYRDFSRLARSCRLDHVKLLGGEPLLHPDLLAVIDAVRASGISQRIEVLTNGKLLLRMADAFWEKIDALRLPQYPGVALRETQRQTIRSKAAAHHVHIRLDHVDTFQASYSETGTPDESLVRRIFNTCRFVQDWHCQTVTQGYFFRCSPSVYLPRVIRNQRLPHPYVDGLKIDDRPGFKRALWRFLTGSQPLSACYHCLGSAGKRVPWALGQRRDWRADQAFPTESLIDWEILAGLERNGKSGDGNRLFRNYRHVALRRMLQQLRDFRHRQSKMRAPSCM